MFLVSTFEGSSVVFGVTAEEDLFTGRQSTLVVALKLGLVVSVLILAGLTKFVDSSYMVFLNLLFGMIHC